MKNALAITGLSILLGFSASAQDLQGEYFFDQDPGVGNGIPITVPPGQSPIATGTLDITGLAPGVHLWFARTKQNGVWGFYGQRRLFYIWDPTSIPSPTPTDIEAAEYFFDHDPGVGNGTSLPISPGASLNEFHVIDITGLNAGIHLWFVRTKQNGIWGFYGQRRLLYIWDPTAIPPPTPTDIEAAEYFFDQDPGPGNGTALAISPGGTINETAVIDITGLTPGVHLWYVRTKQNGSWGFYGERSLFFIWDPADLPGTPTDIEAAEYFIDADPGVGNGTPIVITPGATLDESLLVDVTGIATGDHTWNVRIKQDGVWGLYGEQRIFTICTEDPDPAITFAPSGSCTNGTFTIDVSMPAIWSGDPFRVFNSVDDQADTLIAGESTTFGPFPTGTEILITAGSSIDPAGCTKQYRATLNCWYEDSDSDGFGDPLSSVVAETQPPGYVSDDSDNCPTDPDKIDPLICGCGTADVPTIWYEDLDSDGFGDPAVSQAGYTCIQPAGYVMDNTDNCPNTPGLIDDSCDDGDPNTVNDVVNGACVCIGEAISVVGVRVFLEGAYDPMNGLMKDSLRTLPDFPLNDPYPSLGYAHVGTQPVGPIAGGVLDVIGADAIVDWVVIELRDAIDASIILASQSALLQRDGDVVTLDGISPVTFDLYADDFHVAVSHRNHLGVMTLSSIALDPNVSSVDLTTGATITYGINARKSITGAFPTEALWGGDVLNDGVVKYVGASNDRDVILVTIGGSIPTNTVNAYSGSDVNMDGQVKYVGPENDRDPILVNIGGSVPTNIRNEQLP